MCSSVHVPKVHTESNHGVGVHVVTSLVPLTIDYNMVVLFVAVVVHYAGVYVYMYRHTVHRAVVFCLPRFLVLSPTVISYP